jgi:hypothetical protein
MLKQPSREKRENPPFDLPTNAPIFQKQGNNAPAFASVSDLWKINT